MHLFCTTQLGLNADSLEPPTEEMVNLLSKVAFPKNSDSHIEQSGQAQEVIQILLDHYPGWFDLVSRETLKRRFSLSEARVVRIIPRREPDLKMFGTDHFFLLCMLFAYFLRKHEVLRQHPTLPDRLKQFFDQSIAKFRAGSVGTVLGSVSLYRPTVRRYEYIQAATTLLAHEIVAPENTRYTTNSALILLEAIRCLSECFAFPFPPDVIEEIRRYYEIMHGPGSSVVAPQPEPVADHPDPVADRPDPDGHDPADQVCERVRIPRKGRPA